jgi:hydrogenase maturation protein HypF
MSNKKKTILALGADIKNRFLLAKGGRFHFGPDLGDLSNVANYELFKSALRSAIKKRTPDILICDMHPSYFSAKYLRRNDLRPKPVQHHHAHIASVMQEHNLKGPVIGVAFDGTGYGTDGNIWGGEFLLVNKKDFRRLAHLKYHAMPGGDKVVSEPWRMVLGVLGRGGTGFVKSAGEKEKEAILSMRAKGINSPLTSSAGRLFDAAAALLGICERASYEAEGPMRLEALCGEDTREKYGFTMSKRGGRYIIDTTPLFSGMAKDLKKKRKNPFIAAKFHNSVADIIVKTVKKLSKDSGIKDIALSGGVFQNRFLRKKAIAGLLSAKFSVFINEKTPVNDLNISLGQYHVFSGTREN